MDHDLSRMLMAICNLQGIWDRAMRVPEPSRILLAEQESGHWKLDARGYPVPTKELLDECERLRDQEQRRQHGITAGGGEQ